MQLSFGYSFSFGTLIFSLLITNAYGAERRISEAELAEKLSFYQSISKLEAPFKQTKTLADLGIQMKSEGKLKLVRPNEVIWEIVKPAPVMVKLNDEEIVVRTIHNGKEEITRVGAKEASAESGKIAKNLKNLVAWLNLDAGFLSREYEVGELEKNRYIFQPRNPKESPFENLEMTLAQGGHLQTLLIRERSGDRILIEFGAPKVSRKNK